MATSRAMPIMFPESFSASHLREPSSCRSGWKRKDIQRRRYIGNREDYINPVQKIENVSASTSKVASLSFSKGEDTKDNNFVESNVARLTNRVIQKTNNLPSYSISAHIYTEIQTRRKARKPHSTT